MNRNELIQNDGYWESKIDYLLRARSSKKIICKEILKLKNELIDSLKP